MNRFSGGNNSEVLPREVLEAAQRDFVNRVYAWMFGGLLVTAASAMITIEMGWWQTILYSPLRWILIIAQFGIVIALSGAVQKMKPIVSGLSFIAYSFLTGVTLSYILLLYSGASITNAFLVSGTMFGCMSVWGRITKKDLSGMRNFMVMGLFGLIAAMLINLFTNSGAFDFVINVCGVIIFAGLTAYDTQKIQAMSVKELEGGEAAFNSSITGALILYLDFINIFLFILRLSKGSRN